MGRGMVWPGRDMPWKTFFQRLKEEWSRDRVGDVAGALTFFSVLAIFPFLIFVISLASVVIDPTDAQRLIDELSQVAPPAVTQILGDRIRSLGEQNNVGLLTLGGAAAVFTASGGMVALMRALNTVYGVSERRKIWTVRGIALLMTLLAAAFTLVATLIAIVAPALASAVGGPIGAAIHWLRLPVAGLLVMLLWAVLYYVLPDVEQKFRLITPGSVTGVILWVIASYGFSLYVSRFGKYDATYGALGGVVVFLLWVWISAQVLLLGAEINAVLEHKSPEGKGAGARTLEAPAPNATKSEVEQAGGAIAAERLEHERARRQPSSSEPPRTGWLQRWIPFAAGAAVLFGVMRLVRNERTAD